MASWVSIVQLALAWIFAQSSSIVPLFGTALPHHVQENIKSENISLSQSEIETIEAIISKDIVQGSRHPEMARKFYKTDQ